MKMIFKWTNDLGELMARCTLLKDHSQCHSFFYLFFFPHTKRKNYYHFRMCVFFHLSYDFHWNAHYYCQFFFWLVSPAFNICVWSVNLLVWGIVNFNRHSWFVCVYDFNGTWGCSCKWISMTLIVVVITDDVLFNFFFLLLR